MRPRAEHCGAIARQPCSAPLPDHATTSDSPPEGLAPEASPGTTNARGMRRLGRLFALLRPHWARFALGTVALLVSAGRGLAYPQAVRFAIDQGVRGGSRVVL